MFLHIEHFTVDVIVGILPHERETPQHIFIDATIEYSYQTGFYLDYCLICTLLESRLHQKRYGLLEDALIDLCDYLHGRFSSIDSIELKITKPAIKIDAILAISHKKTFPKP